MAIPECVRARAEMLRLVQAAGDCDDLETRRELIRALALLDAALDGLESAAERDEEQGWADAG